MSKGLTFNTLAVFFWADGLVLSSQGVIYTAAGLLGVDNFVPGGAWPQHCQVQQGSGHQNEGESQNARSTEERVRKRPWLKSCTRTRSQMRSLHLQEHSGANLFDVNCLHPRRRSRVGQIFAPDTA